MIQDGADDSITHILCQVKRGRVEVCFTAVMAKQARAKCSATLGHGVRYFAMFPTAHVASALVFNRLTRLDAGVVPAVLGALAPDTMDKTLAWVFHVVPSARHIGHTPFTAVLLSIGVSAILGRSKGVAFGTAYIIHLVCDLWHAGHVPWLMPFKKYSRRSQRWRVELSPEAALLEAIGAAVMLLLL